MWANMVIFSCVSRDTRCRDFPRVDGLSTDIPVLGRHKVRLRVVLRFIGFNVSLVMMA